MGSAKGVSHTGLALDSVSPTENLLENAGALAAKRVIAWQLKAAMDAAHLTKKEMAKRLGTSRTQVDRLLDPAYVGIGLETVARAAHVVGKLLNVRMVNASARKGKTLSILSATKYRRRGAQDSNARKSQVPGLAAG